MLWCPRSEVASYCDENPFPFYPVESQQGTPAQARRSPTLGGDLASLRLVPVPLAAFKDAK